MPVICFASTKGGVGKTTSAIVLGTTLAGVHTVTLVDADPAGHLSSWAKKTPNTVSLRSIKCKSAKDFPGLLRDAKLASEFVIFDLEGIASRLNAMIMMESDLVIIPMGDSQPDAEGAIETLAQLALEAHATGREIPVRILFCGTRSAVKSRLEKSLNEQVRERIGCFKTELHSRSAFSALHTYGGRLSHLRDDQAYGIDRANDNAHAFAHEVVEVMDWVSDFRDGSRARRFEEGVDV